MKKFFKFLVGAVTAVAAIGGIMYFLKNVLMKDYLDDFDDDDFDNDLYDEDSEDRDYVTSNVPDKDSTAPDAADAAAEQAAAEDENDGTQLS